MGSIEANSLSYALPGGRVLFKDVNFKVGDGHHVALVGINGIGKSTLFRLIAGDIEAKSGHVRVDGRSGIMRQFADRDPKMTVRRFLLSYMADAVQRAAGELADAECAVEENASPEANLRYANALSRWGEVGGYDAEVLWEQCTTAAFGRSIEEVGHRPVATLSGGEQKRLALEALFRSDADVLLLDEPDNFLDIPGKRWLEEKMNASLRTILYVSHDRALLANTSSRVVTLEAGGAWVHPESYLTYEAARRARLGRIEQERKQFRNEKERLNAILKEYKRKSAYNEKFATKANSMEKRIERFERDMAPRERAKEQKIKMDLGGGRTGKIVFKAEDFSIPGLIEGLTTEVHYGERIGVVGPNGAGKSHLLRLLGGEDIAHSGEWKLGARVDPGLFSQTNDRSDLESTPLVDIIRSEGLDLTRAMSGLKRYELHPEAQNRFESLSGGQQARFQLLMMELRSPTMLLLDEPTDNLDIDSAEALERGLDAYRGAVIAVTHDRWFMRLMDRFLVFHRDGSVTEEIESPYGVMVDG